MTTKKHTPDLVDEIDLSWVPDEDLKREYMRRHNQRRAKTPPRPKVMRPCKFCRKKFGARDMRTHLPQCEKRK